jgi:hypothetical protein
MLLASLPDLASASELRGDPEGPERTDCYRGLSQFHRGHRTLPPKERARSQRRRGTGPSPEWTLRSLGIIADRESPNRHRCG